MSKIPEYVYLVIVDGEWPISAIADHGHPASTADRVAREVERRNRSTNVYRPDQVKVWRARLTDVHAVDFMPETVVPPSLHIADEEAGT